MASSFRAGGRSGPHVAPVALKDGRDGSARAVVEPATWGRSVLRRPTESRSCGGRSWLVSAPMTASWLPPRGVLPGEREPGGEAVASGKTPDLLDATERLVGRRPEL